jgi:hypothetical protein
MIEIIEKIVLIALPLFAGSMFMIVRKVRIHNPELIESAILSRFFLNFDLSVFRRARREYFKLKKSNLLLRFNLITFFAVIIGFAIVVISAIVEMMTPM